MRPPKLHVTLLSAMLLMRSEARVLGARVALEVLGATLFALGQSVAFGWIAATPFAPEAWSGSALVLIAGVAAYLALRVIARVGAIAAIFLGARKTSTRGVILEGADGFAPGAAAMLTLFILDVLGFSVLALLLQLGPLVSASHGGFGAFVAAAFTAGVAVTWLAASAFGNFAFVLGVVDGDGLFAAWPRAWRLVASAELETRQRFSVLLCVLGALTMTIAFVDFVSTGASVLAEVEGQGQSVLVVAPILTLVYAMLVDVAAIVFLAALTDRLPLGFAAPIVIAAPKSLDTQGAG
ncbi:MAG: hypothetical protein IT381_28540 [Deltaproteobacteria bacterium]|nr:hypothetical protein [Deltaproteobacteria bacterium]